MVAFLLTHTQKRRVIQWTYETEIEPQRVARATDLTSVRDAVTNTRALLERFLPKMGDLRDALVDEMAEDLVTNPAETDYMFEICTNTDNWYQNEGLALLDLPQHARNMMQRLKEKMLFLNFLTGTATLDEFVEGLGDRIGFPKGDLREMARGMQIRFREANIVIRTYILMSLIDDLEGLLSDAEYSEKVLRLVMGPYADNKIARACMNAYLNALPSGERRVLIARILAGMIDGDDAKRASSAALSMASKVLATRVRSFFERPASFPLNSNPSLMASLIARSNLGAIEPSIACERAWARISRSALRG
ncbi:MAG: hypothetical protein R3B54_16010 [Bdellovibrionota bacterium]